MASNFELACRRGVLGLLALPVIFFSARYFPWLLHLGDKNPWVERRHDTLSSVLSVHGDPRSYLHVGGKVYWVAGDPSYLDLPGTGAVLIRRQIGYYEEELVLVYKGSGEEVRFKTEGFELPFLGGKSVASSDSNGFVVTGNGYEHHFNLANRTQSGFRINSTDSGKN